MLDGKGTGARQSRASAAVGKAGGDDAEMERETMPAPIDDRRKADRGDGSDRRRKPRLRVLLTATVETQDGERAVKLRNLSACGALVELDQPPEVGTLVTFRRGSTVAPATVVWEQGSTIGLEFIRPIHHSEVLIHIKRPDLAW